MKEKNVILVEDVKVLKKRTTTSTEQEKYLERKKKYLQEKGKELDPNLKLEKYVYECEQKFIRKKDGREAVAQIDVRTNLELTEGEMYSIVADWSVNVQGIYLTRAISVIKTNTKGGKSGN